MTWGLWGYDNCRVASTAEVSADDLKRVIDSYRNTPEAQRRCRADDAAGWCEESMEDFIRHAQKHGVEVSRHEFNYPLRSAFPTPHRSLDWELREPDEDQQDQWDGFHYAPVVNVQGTPHVVDWTMSQLKPDAQFPHVESLDSYGSRFAYHVPYEPPYPYYEDDHHTAARGIGVPGPGERTATTALEELDDLNNEDRRRADDDIANFHASRHQDTSPHGRMQNHLYDQFMSWWPTSQAAQERDPQTASTNWHYYPDEPITHWLNVEDFLKENYPQSATGAQLGTEQAQHAVRQNLDPDFMHPYEWDKSGLTGTGDHITQAMLSLHNRIQGRTWESPEDEQRYYDLMLKHVGPNAPRLSRLLTALRRHAHRTAMPHGCEVCGEEAEGTFEGTPVCGDCLRDAHDLPPVPTQPRKLYRGLYTDPDNVEQLLSKGLGRFWTDDPKYAEQFARGNGKDFARENVGYGTTHEEFNRHRPLVVETDWDGTGHTTDLADRFRMDASEYRLDHDTPLTVTRIRQLPEQPGEQERDLLHQPRTHHAHRTAMPAPFPAADVTLQYHHDHHYPSVTAHADSPEPIGYLEWNGPGLDDHGEIADIHVDDDWRHQSIATAMFDFAQQHEPKLHHSDNLSDYGAAWKKYEESRTRPEQFYTKKARTMTAAVTVYTSPNCVQCTMTRKQLDKLGIAHTVVDVTQDPEAHAYITGELGYTQAPVVVVDNGADHWSGFRPDRLKGLMQ